MRAALLLDLARAEHGAGGPAALEHVRARPTPRPPIRSTGRRRRWPSMWATGHGGEERLVEALAMIEAALAGVAGRDRELELRLEAHG